MNSVIQEQERMCRLTLSKLSTYNLLVKQYIDKYFEKEDSVTEDDDSVKDVQLKYSDFETTLTDEDEIADEIFQLLFNSEDITFSEFTEEKCGEDITDLYFDDIPLMINYFNTYFKENFGDETMNSTSLTMDNIKNNYAYAYASHNDYKDYIRQKLRVWVTIGWDDLRTSW